jgi:tRNA-dihydrouridine synthase B
LTVHPRTADQGFSGHSDWGIIRDVKARLKIPVIGNGDIRVPEDALRMIEETGCDAVMIGRASLGNPWIFREIISLMHGGQREDGPSYKDRERMIQRHLEMEMTYIGDVQGLRNFRKHLLWYTKGLKGGAPLRQMLSQVTEREALLNVVGAYFSAQIRP